MTPPVRTQNMVTTLASNTEKRSCESTEARPNSDRRIRNWLVRIDRPRAQGRRPPPDAGTGTRAFNAPTVFSPNPTVTGNVIGSKHPSNRPFLQLYPSRRGRVWPSTVRRSERHVTAPLEMPKVSAPVNRALRSIGPSSEHVPSQRRVRR